MEVVIHTVDGRASTFEVEEAAHQNEVLMGLHPDKAFGHRHVAIQGRQGLTLFVSSKITYVELIQVEKSHWPFHDVPFEAFQVSDSTYGHPSPDDRETGCLFAEIHLSDGKALKMRIQPLANGGGMPAPALVMDRLLSPPSLHVHGRYGKVLLVNGAHIVRCDMCPCGGLPKKGWHAEALPDRAAVNA